MEGNLLPSIENAKMRELTTDELAAASGARVDIRLPFVTITTFDDGCAFTTFAGGAPNWVILGEGH